MTILFNPTARVWTLRFLLLSTIVVVGLWATAISQGVAHTSGVVGITTLCLIFLHHIVVLFRWSFKWLAIIDLVFTLLEIATVIFVVNLSWGDDSVIRSGITLLPTVMTLTISAMFRFASISKSGEKIGSQSFEFLGNCPRTYPPYTPLSILLNRSIAWPLIRGESSVIIIARAIIISGVGCVVPVFAIYSILVAPSTTKVYTRSVSEWGTEYSEVPGNVTIFFRPLNLDDSALKFSIHVVATIQNNGFGEPTNISCAATSDRQLVECPIPWVQILSVSISLSFSQGGGGVDVAPVQGDLDPALAEMSRLISVLNPTPLISGSRLFGAFSWTQRDMILSLGLSGIPSSRLKVYTSEVTGLQPYPSSEPFDPAVATLTLHQWDWVPRQLQDTPDTTALSGISAFGGFWTFINGTFTLLFGANVLYFAFGIRPLSALGVAHMFQRRRLVRQWHEDFPAIHTEGGLPGSEPAGIVAFIRERLVDLEEDSSPHEEDLEVQTSKVEGASEAGADTIGISSPPDPRPDARYIWDEIPLLDVEQSRLKVRANELA